jgi:nicotinate-nucleotide adenylyltransferase
MASAAADALVARSILVIPASINPQRVGAKPPASGADRLAMTRIAFRAEPRAQVLDLEVTRAGPSYTIETLRELLARGQGPLRLLIGSDQAVNLPTWREWAEVVRLAPPAIVLRPPHTRESLFAALGTVFGSDAEHWNARVLPVPPVDLSATTLREGVASGACPTGLDPAVLAYVREHRLYGTNARS